ncbi:MAG: MurR/RpiR family transcriptional regulator [Mycobacterium sp.]
MTSDLPGDHASVRKLVQAGMGALSDGERKVARALLAQYPMAGLTTVSDLASLAGVSSPTVVRFVNRLGFDGFSVLQRALVHELNAELGSPLRQYPVKARRPDGDSLLGRARTSFEAMLSATYDDLPASEFDELVRLLVDESRAIHVAGGRFSRTLAEYFVLHLRLLRADVHLVAPDAMSQGMTVADVRPTAVVVVFDYRRYTDQSHDFALEAARRGATVCLMTDNWLSPVAHVAKVVLPARVESASPFDSLVAATAIGETVIAAVADELGDTGMTRLALVDSLRDTLDHT